MKTVAVVLGLLLLALNVGVAVWIASELHKQSCEINNLRSLEVTDAGKGTAFNPRINADGSKVVTLHAQFPGAQACERKLF